MTADETFARRVTALGALADPVRRALYRFVSAQSEPVSRHQAADAVDVAHHTAKFHLDRLVDEGLLVTEFRRLTGRRGPGAGRPAKLYRRAELEVEVSLPHRRYDIAGLVLADAVEQSLAGTPVREALVDAAGRAADVVVASAPGGTPGPEPRAKDQGRDKGKGRSKGKSVPEGAGDDPATAELDRLAGALTPYGFEPQVDDDLVLANCPFDRLAAEHREVVCGMNLALVGAVGERLGCSAVSAVLDPHETRCCVRVVRTEDAPEA